MKIALTSDLHRGHSNKTDRIQRKYMATWLEENGMPDALVLAGDLVSTKPNYEMESLFKMLNGLFTCPILAVRGNHDFWAGEGHPTLHDLNCNYAALCAKYGILNLEGEVARIDGQWFAGWLSWWMGRAPDQDRMSGQVGLQNMRELEDQSFKNMDFQLALVGAPEDVILVTHMPPNGGAWSSRETLLPKCQVLMTGHTHLWRDEVYPAHGKEGTAEAGSLTRMLNCGPDYDRPSIYLYDTITKEFSGKGGNIRRNY